MVIGVAGGYCVGKDAVVGILGEAGYPSIDVDAVGHRVLSASSEAVAAAFGPGILDGRGGVERGALGRLVFRDAEARGRLEGIVHPAMYRIVAEEVRRLDRRCVINAAILYRMGLQELCDLVICVRAPLLVRLVRARRRDGIGPIRALDRIRAQRGICLKPMGARVDTHTVRNAGSVTALRRAVLAVLHARPDSTEGAL